VSEKGSPFIARSDREKGGQALGGKRKQKQQGRYWGKEPRAESPFGSWQEIRPPNEEQNQVRGKNPRKFKVDPSVVSSLLDSVHRDRGGVRTKGR